VLIAFFILAIQLFVTLIEFKLTTLAGFVLIPFGLFGKTAFMAERVLGNVISSGIKVLVLAVIIGIGSTLFAQFTAGFGGASRLSRTPWRSCSRRSRCSASASSVPASPTALSRAARSLAQAPLLEPHLPQVVRLSAALRGQGLLQVRQAVRSLALSVPARASPAGRLRLTAWVQPERAAQPGVASGLGGVAQAAAGAATSPLRKAAASLKQDFREGGRSAVTNTGGTISGGAPAAEGRASAPSAPPAWAANMKNRQSLSHGATVARILCAQVMAAGLGPPSMFQKRIEAMFRRPTVHYGKSLEPVTPYQRAAQVWDERIGSARVQAKNWRLAFFGTLALSGGLAAGLVWQGVRGTIVPWVVQVDRLGEAQAVAPAMPTIVRPIRRSRSIWPASSSRSAAIPGRSDHRAAELAARL
jgi:hypothetical protein